MAPDTGKSSEKEKHLDLRVVIKATIKPWEKSGETTKLAGAHGLSLIQQTFIHPSPKEGADPVEVFTMFTKKDGFTVLTVTRDKQIVVIRQFKQGAGLQNPEDGIIYELPSGVGSGSGDAAREVAEETGYRAGRVVELSKCLHKIAPRKSPSGYRIYAALDCEWTGKQSLDSSESAIEVYEASAEEVLELVLTGQIHAAESRDAFLTAYAMGHFRL